MRCPSIATLIVATICCGNTGAGTITQQDRQWWAFQPVQGPTVPQLADDNWSRNDIDRFVLQRLRQQAIEPAPEADRETLIRRLYFDLIGLPPTPEEVDRFLQDKRSDAWQRLVDQLLEDDRYGEHWGRYWLDIVRYAESDGWKEDAYRSHIWMYRDYVVRALNDDIPYSQFVLEQLAGDEMPDSSVDGLAATGFLRLGIYEDNQRNAQRHWNDILNEITDVTGDVFLGLGMVCSRCHDHKFDPILQRDYFQLRAFFEPMMWRDDRVYASAAEIQQHEQQLAKWELATQEIRTEIDQLLAPYVEKRWKFIVDKFPFEIQACFHKPASERTAREAQMAYLVTRQCAEYGANAYMSLVDDEKTRYEQLQEALKEFDSIKPASLPRLMSVSDFERPASTTIIPESNQEVLPGFLTVLRKQESAAANITQKSNSSGRRTALAKWIGSSENPLTHRVWVNRVWQHHFGRGLVSTSNDFGRLGAKPSHPELLDWLVTQYLQDGQRLKQLHRLIVTSKTWRQSARHPDRVENQRRDPDDQLLWRAQVRRLSAEQIRDALLTATAEMNNTVGGPSVKATSNRRSLYVRSLRNTRDEFLQGFDIANGLKSVPLRDVTTSATQSLMMINGDYTVDQAVRLSTLVLESDVADAGGAVQVAIQRTWGRHPTQQELSDALEFLGVSAATPSSSIDQTAMADLCHVLINASQFLYLY